MKERKYFKIVLPILALANCLFFSCKDNSRDMLIREREKTISSTGPVTTLSVSAGESDYPSMCSAPDGSAWVVWQSYQDGADQLYVFRWKNDYWYQPFVVPTVEGDILGPDCAVDGQGTLWLVWAEQRHGDWDLWTTSYLGMKWSKPERIMRRRRADFNLDMASSVDGSLFSVWQAWNNDNFDIFLSELSKGKWSTHEEVTNDGSNDWMPSLAVSSDGTINVCWDSYRNGSYDVFVRQKTRDHWRPEILVAGSEKFEAYSQLTVDKDDSVWISFEERSLDATNTGPLITPMGELPPTNKKMHITGMFIAYIVDGKIKEDVAYFDMLKMMQQLGFTLIPPKTPEPPEEKK